MSFLAIDQGTTNTRGIVFEPDGRAEVVFQAAHEQYYPQPGWVEHDPEQLLANVRGCFEAAAARGPLAAAGIANQGESCLAWDARTGEALAPVIVWQDDRTAADTARLKAQGAEALTLERSGLPLDPYFSASKLGWILSHVPRARALAEAGRLRLGTTDAFFRNRLTGRFATDVSTASRTALMALDDCRWDAELCALFGVPLGALPEIGDTLGDLGAVPAGGQTVPLTASVVDQQASLYGHGCRRPGDLKITFGTGAFALTLAGHERPPTGDGLLPTVAWRKPGEAAAYALDGGVYTVSAAANWARSLGLFDAFEDVAAFDGPPAAARGLYFVPALAGLACPHWDRTARASWLGLTLDTHKRDMVRAVFEGIAFRTAEVVGAIEAVQPVAPPVSIDGGMSANPHFVRFLADTLGRPLRVSDNPELSALGTAMLAAEGAGRQIARPPGGTLVEPRGQPEAYRKGFEAARRAVQAFGAAMAGGAARR